MMKSVIFVVLILYFAGIASAESLSDVINIPSEKAYPKKRWGRDPFIKYSSKEEQKAGNDLHDTVRISGIISDGTKSVAIINGNFYRTGSVVDGFRIMDISNERILLEKNGKKYYYGIEKFALEGGKK